MAQVNRRTVGDVSIVAVTGKITIGVGDVVLRGAVQDELDNGSTKILLDLGSVTTIDSSGIGELVSAYTRATNRGAKLKLVNLPPKIHDILAITQLITVFDVYDTEDEAVKSFA
ncbi:STAS domain-containing protein [Streptomyces microflavus]|uniref:STAS domain-containing protein n=1 Tax=Streptomyces TaxID=1883 RepID=UPI000517362C|nr:MULTISPECIES: STAS domain-containing protein [Streptomyces]MCX4652147.1 STAS domain-containing protein [Streptomyces microflavus]MDX2402557.1 STAS domain-containing protein [Streptomyces microflavus]MDX2976844.1 STAS domain-containing protein [Streptomyces sp. NRRL_B-2249]WSS36929.1 STAS domain-containing protein [Streptomyces microflavus]WST14620.1 STAS domain-containing protein [Streptomyces microflavus]